MRNHKKLNQPQIRSLADLFHCKITDGFMGSTYVDYNGRRVDIGMWYECKEWSRDQWRNTFERISNTKTAELWNKANGNPTTNYGQEDRFMINAPQDKEA